MPTIEVECDACGGTGISGMGEDNRTGVICYQCEGSGKSEISYEEFTGRKRKKWIKHVYQCNPGVKVGGADPARFGGMSYKDWLSGKPFPEKSENRECTCPAWWYQTADYNLKPEWDECLVVGAFSLCPHFEHKASCWARFDQEGDDKLKNTKK